ncbi:putative neuropeptide Y receptor type 6 [Ruditapes philippinarum]|uniref:putative neuropeptide Y receptor type 6 n=1 Tax=Ruditapes philippinarum TaxID=129788 RepID=UPI00295AF483|nr:putative neuropeptide Y receptor type 6 [Ruditapes philippinarum]
MSSNTEDELFLRTQKEIFLRILPVATAAGFLLIVSVIGNILTLLFYMKKTKRSVPTLLIKYLAAGDTVTCAVAIPFIPEMIINIGYTLRILCKVTHFMGMWAGSISTLLLWIIAIDRYRKICKPLGGQIAVSSAKYIGIGIVIFSLLLATRLLATYEIFKVNVTLTDVNETIQTYYCSASDDGIFKQIGLVFYLVDFSLNTMVLVTVLVTYSRIIYELNKRRKSMSEWGTVNVNSVKSDRTSHSSGARNVSDTENPGSSTNGETVGKRAETTDNSVKSNQTEISTISRQVSSKDTSKSKNKASSTKAPTKNFEFSTAKKPSEWNLTMMMLAVSVLYILCFTPYFTLRIIIRLVLKTDKEYDFGPGIQFALMLPFFNSVFNPIIYSIFNPKFRSYIATVVLNCLKCNRNK